MKINTAEADYISNNFYGQVHCKFTFQKAKETFKETPTMNNDTLEKAHVLQFNKTYDGFIARNDEYDYYEFSLEKSGKVYIELERDPEKNMQMMIRRSINDFDTWGIFYNMVDLNDDPNKETYELYLNRGKYYLYMYRYNMGYGQYNFKVPYRGMDETFVEDSSSANSEDVKGTINLVNADCKTINGVLTYYDSSDEFDIVSSLVYPGEVNTIIDIQVHHEKPEKLEHFYTKLEANYLGEVILYEDDGEGNIHMQVQFTPEIIGKKFCLLNIKV